MSGIIYLTGFPGPAGVLDIPSTGQFPVSVGADPIDLQAHRGLSILLRVAITNPDSLVSIQGPPFPAGFLDFPTGFQVDFAGGVETIYPAASLGRSSAPDDTPADLYVPGKSMPVNYQIKLFSGIEPSPESSGGYGNITLVDPDGELDYLTTLAWDGALLDILRGPPLARYDTYETVARITTGGIGYDQRKKLLLLRDLGWLLRAGELHGLRYAGTGGKEGDAALAGAIKPYGAGPNFNVAALRIDSTLEIYQLSCSSILAVDDVRDGGVSLDFDADYATYADLAAATVAPSEYATCLAEGFIRLGSTADHPLTVDFRGDNDTVNGQAYPDTRGRIARRIATARGLLRIGEDQIDTVSFQSFETEHAAPVGFYWDKESTKAEALSRVMEGVLGWWAVRLNGRLAIGYMAEPVGLPALTLNYPEDFGGEPAALDSYQAPRRATQVTWRVNNMPLDASDLASSVSVDQSLALIYAATARFATAADNLQANLWPTSALVTVSGNFWEESDALAEARRQQTLMGIRRERWSIKAPVDPFTDLLGRVIQVNDYPRFAWGASRRFICVGMSFDSSLSTTLELWG